MPEKQFTKFILSFQGCDRQHTRLVIVLFAFFIFHVFPTYCRSIGFSRKILHNSVTEGAIVGKIVNVAAEEAVLDEKDRVDPAKLNALIFDQFRHGYYVTGEQVGKAWNAGAALMKK